MLTAALARSHTRTGCHSGHSAPCATSDARCVRERIRPGVGRTTSITLTSKVTFANDCCATATECVCLPQLMSIPALAHKLGSSSFHHPLVVPRCSSAFSKLGYSQRGMPVRLTRVCVSLCLQSCLCRGAPCSKLGTPLPTRGGGGGGRVRVSV